MDAITMPSTTPLLQRLKSDYPQFQFVAGARYAWSPDEQAIFYDQTDNNTLLLHELSHGLLKHSDYSRDIELLKMERDAWEQTKQLAAQYNQVVDEVVVETALDTYRDWLHARSTCPNCSATGLQVKKQTYNCPACGHNWRVNEARICGLKRYTI
jgi:predicted RNA-binding Zn-ribbon protein involved in translation (DUF1610 family)